MIRDPSDGTVRETGAPSDRQFDTDLRDDEMVSGLPLNKPDAKRIAQLEKSRDWLRGYFNRTSEQTKTGLRSTESGEG